MLFYLEKSTRSVLLFLVNWITLSCFYASSLFISKEPFVSFLTWNKKRWMSRWDKRRVDRGGRKGWERTVIIIWFILCLPWRPSFHSPPSSYVSFRDGNKATRSLDWFTRSFTPLFLGRLLYKLSPFHCLVSREVHFIAYVVCQDRFRLKDALFYFLLCMDSRQQTAFQINSNSVLYLILKIIVLNIALHLSLM